VSYTIVLTKNAEKDLEKVNASKLKSAAYKLLEILQKNPLQTPPRYEKLSGNLKGAFSRRINRQHRLVYQVIEDEKVVKVLRMWTHYE
jgi:toxin YoeB